MRGCLNALTFLVILAVVGFIILAVIGWLREGGVETDNLGDQASRADGVWSLAPAFTLSQVAQYSGTVSSRT